MEKHIKPLETGIYFVATPIGSARDITLRALDILAQADILAAEDTRNTRKLLEIHGVPLGSRPLIPYHDHNGAKQRPRLLAALKEGKTIAYVSDAGTPLIADPGFALARDAIEQELPVFSAPGASALLAALSVAGLPTDRFCFEGFLPAKEGARKSTLDMLKNLPSTLIFYESPKRIGKSLVLMSDILGNDRQGAVCRELTKKFEEVRRGTLEELAAYYQSHTPKGEIVLVIGPPIAKEASKEDVHSALKTCLDQGMSTKDAAEFVSKSIGVNRRTAYNMALGITKS